MTKLTNLLALLVFLLLAASPARAVTASYADNFDSDPAATAPPNFSYSSNGSITSASWKVAAPSSDHVYEATLANGPAYGSGISSSILYVSNLGGTNQNNFVLSSTIAVKSAPATYNIGLVACALSQPQFISNFYYAGCDQSGNIFIRSNDTSTAGLTLGTATNLSGGLVVGTTYTVTLQGTYNAGTLTLLLTITDGVHNASLSATASSPLTGNYFGYQYDIKTVGGALTADANNFSVSLGLMPNISTNFGDNFSSYAAGATPGGFTASPNGSIATNSWTVVNNGTANVYEANLANNTLYGNGIAASVRGVPFCGGPNQSNFTYSTTMKVITAPSSYSLGVVALAGSQPIFNSGNSYYYAGVNQAGTVFLRSSNSGTTGLSLGTATNLPGGLVTGTTYTFVVQGIYTTGTLTLNYSVTDGTHTGSLSATTTAPLTGGNFGYQHTLGPTGAALKVDQGAFNISVPLTFTGLTFDDEFNGTALNTTLWSTGPRTNTLINQPQEIEGYVPQNVSVANGYCTFTAQEESCQNIDMYGNKGSSRSYASGEIQGFSKWTQTYGYFEARIRMSNAIGTWPAFWLLPDRGAGYGNGTLDERVAVGNTIDGNTISMGNEIDAVEYMDAWKTSAGLSQSHSGYIWNYSGGSSVDYARTNDGTGPFLFYPTADTAFHTYGVYWAPGVVTFYLDGNVILTRTSSTNVSVCPEYMTLNLALSTDNWGVGTTPTLTAINAALPTTMDVDYVRVWSIPATPAP